MNDLHNTKFFFVSVQRPAQTSFRIFLQPRIMVEGAKFNSHDRGGHFKSRLLKEREDHNETIFVVKITTKQC